MKKSPILRLVLFISLTVIFFIQPIFNQNVENFSIKKSINKSDQLIENFKIESALNKIIKIYTLEGIHKLEEYAKFQPRVDLKNDNIRIIISLLGRVSDPDYSSQDIINSSLDHLIKNIQSMGGLIELNYKQKLQVMFPLTKIKNLINLPDLGHIRLPYKPYLHTVSEGYQFHGAEPYKNLPPFQSYKKAKVGILDLGFKAYESLLGSELPEEVTAQSFRFDSDISGGGISHGTACAEIVHDMSEDSILYLANFNTSLEMAQAVDWLVDEGCNIISCSIGWYNIGAGDGTGPIGKIVDDAYGKGVIWVNSSGNDANSHWEGNFEDSNSNGSMDFGGDELFTFYMPAYQSLWVFMNWNDWGTWDGYDYSGSSNDYNLYLYYFNGIFWEYVDSSEYSQNGMRGQYPTEGISGWYSTSSAKWGIRIKKKSGAAIKKIELFFDFNYSYDHEFIDPWGSVGIPADAPNAIAVGAIPWLDGYTDYYYTYSGRGPTSDGRIKPDIAAASSVSNDTYGTFGGTSASCPHVAGAIALIYNKTPYTLSKIIELINTRADDWGATGKDNIFGIGKLDLDD